MKRHSITPFLATFFIALIFLVSCRGERYKEQMEGIEHMLQKLDTVEQHLAGIDTGRAKEVLAYADQQMDSLQERYQEDTIGKGLFPVFTELKEVNKSFGSVPGKYEGLQEELTYSRQQLKDLEKDLEEGAFDPEKTTSYYQVERKAVEKLEARVKALKIALEKGEENMTQYKQKKKKALEREKEQR